MALQAFVTSVSGAGIRGNLEEIDDAFVAQGVSIGSSDSAAIVGTGSNHTVDIYGTVVGNQRGIILGNGFSVDSGNAIYIGATGYVGGYLFGNFTVRLQSYSGTVENDGTITGKGHGVSLGGNFAGTTSTLTNTGLIKSKYIAVAQTGTETVVVNNSGTILGSFDDQGSGVTVINNSGTFTGDVFLAGDSDTFDTRSGTYTGIVRGGSGADKLLGSTRGDTFFGDEDADRLYGYNGDDKLDGGAGDDYISGGNGNDQITGGLGKDELRGGTGADKFIFTSASDSTPAAAGRDLIADFSQSQKDRIDLSLIDAKAGGGANDKFTFIGKSGYSGNEGELRYKTESGVTKIWGDIDGDGATDFAIWVTGTFTLTAADFVL